MEKERNIKKFLVERVGRMSCCLKNYDYSHNVLFLQIIKHQIY